MVVFFGALILLAGAYLLFVLPAYTVADRIGTGRAWIALIPFVGVWIVLFESLRRSGWWALITLIPYLNLVALVWVSVELPLAHKRSPWWILAFFIPGVNFIAYYAYAFTLQPPSRGYSRIAVAR